MTKIKICGLKRKIDIEYANICKPDFVGFVFSKSKRQVSIQEAKILKSNLDLSIKSVGVFVNEDVDLIKKICNQEIIDIIQLHGDETDEYINLLRKSVKKSIIKAIPVKEDFTVKNSYADILLFDAFSKTERGGTGKAFCWDNIKNYPKPYFLAGGININNILQAIDFLSPYCIDVSSGAETNGVKDFNKMCKLVKAVRSKDNE